MKITDFLKRHSLIDDQFIDDFYSFYDDGHNEYDYTINLEKLAFWLEVQKGHLKTLLETNFVEDEDYIIYKDNNGKGKGIGGNNRKNIMLNYTCAKELCMLSRSEKSSVIRKFYIDLEKLIITYKDSIVRDLNNQLGINETNKQLIEKHKNKGLIYVLKVDDSPTYDYDTPIEVKIGGTEDLKNRMKQYNVGRINELPIVFVYLTDQVTELEICIKQNLKAYQIKHKTETYQIDIKFIKETIKYCTKKNALLLKKNSKLLNKKDDRKFLIIIDKENIDQIDDLLKGVKKIKKSKTNSKKTSSKKSRSKTSSKKSRSKTSSKKSRSKTNSKKSRSKTSSKKSRSKKLNIKTQLDKPMDV
jgi:phage anti-repressor protein